MTDFAGELGWLRKLAVQYRGMDQPGTKVIARGKVIKKYTDNGHHLVDCEIWLENAKGEKTTPGSATVMLPSRNAGLVMIGPDSRRLTDALRRVSAARRSRPKM